MDHGLCPVLLLLFYIWQRSKNSTIRKVNKKIIIISQMIDETEGAAGRRIRRYPLFLYHRK